MRSRAFKIERGANYVPLYIVFVLKTMCRTIQTFIHHVVGNGLHDPNGIGFPYRSGPWAGFFPIW